MPKQDNIQLAERVLKKIKEIVVCDNDIIPFVNIPVFIPAKMDEYIDRFGDEQVGKYIAQRNKLNKWRMLANRYNDPKTGVNNTASRIAITLAGVGACEEHAHRTLIELFLAGCNTPLSFIMLEGKPNPNRNVDNHMLVIMGDCSILRSQNNAISALDNLPESYLYIDAYLNKIGKAKDITTELQDFIKVCDIEIIRGVQVVHPGQHDFRDIFSDAIRMYAALRGQYDTIQDESGEYLNAAFFAQTNPGAKVMNSLMLACKYDPDLYKTVKETNLSLALRKVCASGKLEIVQKIFAVVDVFGSDLIDIHAKSSNGKTALDWASTAKVDANTKQAIIDLLILRGATPDLTSLKLG